MKRVLIVEDEKINQSLLLRAIQPLGFEAQVADDGEKGLQAAVQNPPMLVITDVVMPGMNGYELVRRLRRMPAFATIPIIVLTAQSDLADKLEAFEAGADDYMTKPFQAPELVARINVSMRRKETLQLPSGQPTATAPVKQAQVIAVHSLRGGVGASSLVVNLSAAIAQVTARSTLALDLVLTAGQIALMMDAPLKRTWADIARFSPEDLDWEALQTIIGRHDSGVYFIAAPTFPSQAEEFTPDMFNKAFGLLRGQFDTIVVDLPHDFSENSLTVLDAASTIVLIMAPELASLRAAAAAMDTYHKLDYPNSKIKLVLSWIFERKGLRRKIIEDTLHQPVELILPFFPDVFIDAINQGKPIFYHKPNEKISEGVEAFARTLCKS
jgi:pilus assembly protein CpaE